MQSPELPKGPNRLMDNQEKDPAKWPESPDPITDGESNVSEAERDDLETAGSDTFEKEGREQDTGLQPNEDHRRPESGEGAGEEENDRPAEDPVARENGS